MTTGLLEDLKKKNYNLKDWILEDLIRQFGICISLRDDNYNMSKKDILKALQQRDDDSRKSIEKSLNQELPKELTKKELKEKFDKILKDSKNRIKEAKEQNIKYENVINELNKISYSYNGNDELVLNLFDMARKQLAILKDDIEWDIKYYTEKLEKCNNFDNFILDEKQTFLRSVERVKEEKLKAIDKKPLNYAEQYKKLIKLINNL